jgi:Zn-dependent metalloprotease
MFSSDVVASPESLGRVESNAVKAARAQLIHNADKWGIDSAQFKPSIAVNGVAGISIVRFIQSIAGVEVANSLLAITVSSDGSLLGYTKSTSNYLNSSQAVISKEQATELLKSKLALSNGISPDLVAVLEIKLVIVDSALVDNVPAGKYLAWRASTSIFNDATSISMTYMSQDGQQVLSTLSFVREINNTPPFVCDLQQTDQTTLGVFVDQSTNNKLLDLSSSNSILPLCGLNTVGRLNDPTDVSVINIDRSWDYFNSVLSQDINEEKYLGNVSTNANGDLTPRISAFTRVCALEYNENTRLKEPKCPYVNAFWVPWVSDECASGYCSGIFFGQGFERADDVIAHELAHGVTSSLAFSSAMANNSETSALSEAVSDIFGEAMDQLSVQPGEAADPAWTIGEDARSGGFRNLRNPNVLKIDSKWVPGDSHENGGPVNRLAYVLANGGKIGKVTIKSLGSTANSVTKNDLCDVAGECLGTVRMSQLVFTTVSNLTATASYFDFGRAMNTSCFALLKAETSGFSATSCKTVQSALTAQGFTSASIKLKKIPAKSKRGKPLTVSAAMNSINGTAVSGQKLALQVLVGSKWVTKQSRVTDASGKAAFKIKLNAKRKYSFRVVTYSYSGLYAIKSSYAKTTVS